MPPQFSMWAILKHTFAVIKTGLAPFAVVALAFVVFWHIAIELGDRSANDFSWWNFSVVRLGSYLIGGCAEAALVYGTLLMLRGGKPLLRDLLRGLSFVVPIMVVSVIRELPTVGAELLQAGNPDQYQSVPVHVVLGIGTYILYVLWFAAAPAIIAEDLGALAAMGRSVALTRGKRWPIFGLVFVGGLLFEAVQLLSDHAARTAPAGSESDTILLMVWATTYVVPAIAVVFWSVAMTITYYTLRLAKEGVEA